MLQSVEATTSRMDRLLTVQQHLCKQLTTFGTLQLHWSSSQLNQIGAHKSGLVNNFNIITPRKSKDIGTSFVSRTVVGVPEVGPFFGAERKTISKTINSDLVSSGSHAYLANASADNLHTKKKMNKWCRAPIIGINRTWYEIDLYISNVQGDEDFACWKASGSRGTRRLNFEQTPDQFAQQE